VDVDATKSFEKSRNFPLKIYKNEKKLLREKTHLL